jgi:hypothetical protein
VATACGLATLREIQKPGFFDALSARTRQLVDGLKAVAAENGVPFSADSEGGMFGFFLLPELPQNYAKDEHRQGALQPLLPRDAGRDLSCSGAVRGGFVSAAHSDADIDATLAAARTACADLRRSGSDPTCICTSSASAAPSWAAWRRWREAGHKVTGCDANVYPPMSTQLEALGIELIEGFGAEQLALKPDVFVIGNVVTRGERFADGSHPRRRPALHLRPAVAGRARAAGPPRAGRGRHARQDHHHLHAGLDPGARGAPARLPGGVPQNFGVSARLGERPSSSRPTSTTPPSSTSAASSCTTGRAPPS